jgi:predicted transcriptional regulator of viral defense system
MISEETVDKKKPKAVKERPRKKAMKVAKKKPGEKRITNTDMIVGLIQSSAEGITTTELKEKTGLTDRQIWTIISIAKKRGKIKQAKRGVSVGA